jgi:integrase
MGGNMGIYRRKNKEGKYYGSWYIQYPAEADPWTGKIKYACEKVGLSQKLAERAFHQKMLKWQERKVLGLEKKRDYTFAELADWYLSLPKTAQIKSVAKIKQHCRKLNQTFGQIKAEKISSSMVEEYQQKRLSEVSCRGTAYKPASVNRELEVMRRIFNLAIREEMVMRNPCWKVTRLPERNARDRVLTTEEWERLIMLLPQHAADVVITAFHTGMRAGEIFGMTWDRVNLKDGYFVLRQKDTKTGEGRHVYFNGEVRQILERLGKVRSLSHTFVFTYRGKPLKSIKVGLASALKKGKIENFRLHDLRHTFTTNARKAGVHETVIMKLTGHKTRSMFTRYNSVDEADARQALNLMESYFGSTGKPTTAIVLQGQKRGQDKSPNPLNLLAPRAGLEPAT